MTFLCPEWYIIFQSDGLSKLLKKFKRSFKMTTKPKTTIIVGAGCRGSGYPYYAKLYPDELKVCITDPYLDHGYNWPSFCFLFSILK